MRRVFHSSNCVFSNLCAKTCKPVGVASLPAASILDSAHLTTLFFSARLQGTFGGGGRGARGFRGGNSGGGGGGRGGGGRGGGAETAAGVARRAVINKTGDGELSELTRSIMRDDSKILTKIVKHIPPNGAISLKSLNAQLPPEVQEAISEKHDGLKGFLEQRKQLFVVRANPADGVLYAAATPLAYQKLVAREKQRETMQEMLGLNRRRGFGGRDGRGRGRGGRGGGRGGGGGGGGMGARGRGRGGGPEQQSRGRGGNGGGYGRGFGRGRGGGGGGGMMGGEQRSFGTQSRR